MSDRETLEAALHEPPSFRSGIQGNLIDEAAYERLAQIPETCETCGGSGKLPEPPKVGTVDFHTGLCASCHGRGTVYPAELVGQIADALQEYDGCNYGKVAVAVLDAINGYGQTGRET